ncbi:MAG: ATP-binding cassette domain-containing protein [Chloroflexi bacterium]|nr:ATP-binding cassette domain-containing protein [Chloroflexota bacterium]
MLEMQKVSKLYDVGLMQVTAIDALNLSVARGEIVLVMGPSGSGKTTLLLMAGGLLRPTSGTIHVDGRDISGLADGELSQLRREKVGFVFQSFNLLSALSAAENVQTVLNLSGRKGEAASGRARELLGEFGLRERLQFRPSQLSGGEKQRVSIARALANDPALILADEPTANLDSQRGHEIMGLLRDVAREKGKTIIIVSHDQRIKDVADRVVWLEDGRLREAGAVIHDPVCGMALEDYKAAAVSRYKDRTYYFCAPGCKRVFDADPEKYVGKTPEMHEGH